MRHKRGMVDLPTRWILAAGRAVLPHPELTEPTEALVDRVRRRLPRRLYVPLVIVLGLVWLLAAVARRGRPTRAAAFAAWVDALARSRVALLRNLGVWIKATGCLVMLGEPRRREVLYRRAGFPMPSQVAVPAAEPAPAPPEVTAADVIVVGSGPAGATVARALAKAGRDVLILEEGAPAARAYGTDSIAEALGERFRGMAMFTSTGPERIPVLQGRCVGGSSTVNSAIAWRAPEAVFAGWHADPHLAAELPLERITRAYDAIEAAIGIERTPEKAWGESNALMARGAAALGVRGVPTDRYTCDCVGLGRCLEGCPLGRKLSMNVTFIPEALAAGAHLLSDCLVERVEFAGERAVGVVARRGGRKVRFVAHDAVVLAASAIQTPILLGASGVRHRQLGRRFQAHPGGSLVGIFDQPVRRVLGATQGFDVPHWVNDGFKVEVLTLPDELLISRMVGVGADLVESSELVPNAAVWAVPIRARAHGRVGGGLAWPRVDFHLTPADQVTLGKGLLAMAQLFFAAGAREVWPNIAGLPARWRSVDEARVLADGVSPTSLNMTMSHLFGTAWMGGDAQAHVCSGRGKVWGTTNLFVADSSLFPTNLGVNPQHTVMAVAQHVAWRLLGD